MLPLTICQTKHEIAACLLGWYLLQQQIMNAPLDVTNHLPAVRVELYTLASQLSCSSSACSCTAEKVTYEALIKRCLVMGLQSARKFDGVLTAEAGGRTCHPPRYTDSSLAGMRMINLTTDLRPRSINLRIIPIHGGKR